MINIGIVYLIMDAKLACAGGSVPHVSIFVVAIEILNSISSDNSEGSFRSVGTGWWTRHALDLKLIELPLEVLPIVPIIGLK